MTKHTSNFPEFEIGASLAESSLSSLPFSFDKRHYKKDSRFVNDLYTLTYDDHESLDSVRLFSSFANQVSTITSAPKLDGDFSPSFPVMLLVDTNWERMYGARERAKKHRECSSWHGFMRKFGAHDRKRLNQNTELRIK